MENQVAKVPAATNRGVQDIAPVLEAPAPRIEIKGRFNQFMSPYWALMTAALPAVRYGISVMAQQFKWNEKDKNGNDPSWLKRSLQPILVGAFLYTITGFYAARTWGDMKRVYSNTLAEEFNKKPEQVGLRDFMHSKNTMVVEARQNFFKYNRRRIAASSFFIPFLHPTMLKNITSDRAADTVMITNGAYLMSDVIGRKATSFEELQSFIDRKLNQRDRIGEKVTAEDLINIYDHHIRKKYPERSLFGKQNTPQWQDVQKVFGRMADLMNQTYKNTPAREHASFHVDREFVALVGNGLIDMQHVDRTLALVEVANRYHMKAVRQVAANLEKGVDLQTALQGFPIAQQPASEPAPAAEAGPAFAAQIGRGQKPIQQPSASMTERVAQETRDPLSPAF